MTSRTVMDSVARRSLSSSSRAGSLAEPSSAAGSDLAASSFSCACAALNTRSKCLVDAMLPTQRALERATNRCACCKFHCRFQFLVFVFIHRTATPHATLSRRRVIGLRDSARDPNRGILMRMRGFDSHPRAYITHPITPMRNTEPRKRHALFFVRPFCVYDCRQEATVSLNERSGVPAEGMVDACSAPV